MHWCRNATSSTRGRRIQGMGACTSGKRFIYPAFPLLPSVVLTRSISASFPVSRRTFKIVLAWLTTFARAQICWPSSIHIIDPTGLVSAIIKLADMEGCDTMPRAGALMFGGISACSSSRRPKKQMSKERASTSAYAPLPKSSRPIYAS